MGLGLAAWVGACTEHQGKIERNGGGPAPSQNNGDASVPENAVRWCEVRAALEAKCHRCHGDPPQVGPFPLVTYAQTQAIYPPGGERHVWEFVGPAVSSGFMPLIADGLPVEGEPLTEREKCLILTWVEQGALLVGPEECEPSMPPEPNPEVCPESLGAGGSAGAGG
jgi:hypothetical protein